MESKASIFIYSGTLTDLEKLPRQTLSPRQRCYVLEMDRTFRFWSDCVQKPAFGRIVAPKDQAIEAPGRWVLETSFLASGDFEDEPGIQQGTGSEEKPWELVLTTATEGPAMVSVIGEYRPRYREVEVSAQLTLDPEYLGKIQLGKSASPLWTYFSCACPVNFESAVGDKQIKLGLYTASGDGAIQVRNLRIAVIQVT